MRILRIPFMVIGLVNETQSLVRVVFSHASAAASGSLACSCLPRKSEEAAKTVSLQNRCQ